MPSTVIRFPRRYRANGGVAQTFWMAEKVALAAATLRMIGSAGRIRTPFHNHSRLREKRSEKVPNLVNNIRDRP